LTLALDACGYRDIRSILDMEDEDIDNLKYTDDDDDEVVQIGVGVMSPFKFPLRILKKYHLYRYSQGDPIQDWTSVTADEYNNFRLYVMRLISPSTTSPNSAVQPSILPRTRDPIADFKKGIKRDSNFLFDIQG
jgi:hypothetical protein